MFRRIRDAVRVLRGERSRISEDDSRDVVAWIEQCLSEETDAIRDKLLRALDDRAYPHRGVLEHRIHKLEYLLEQIQNAYPEVAGFRVWQETMEN